MYLVYIDEAMEQNFCAISALAIPHDKWDDSLQMIKAFRRSLRDRYGIYVRKELHAWRLVSGRGRIAPKPIPKGLRCFIYREILKLVTELPGVMLFNATGSKKHEDVAFERLLNRIQRNAEGKGTHALLLCDEGKEHLYPSISRQRRVHNPIPSQFGGWGATGATTKQIPTKRIIEDPVFLRSDRSYFVQLADCCAYALLRRECQLPAKNAYNLHLAFNILDPILVRKAFKADPHGIIRAA